MVMTLGRLMISIHAAREGGDMFNLNIKVKFAISIHAAREGGDGVCSGGLAGQAHFNPRRP